MDHKSAICRLVRRISSLSFVIVCLVLVHYGQAGSEMFRNGAEHSGFFAGPEVGAFGGIQWRKMADGAVRSSPVVAGGRVFVGDSAGFLYSFDERNGLLNWKHEAGAPIVSSPAVADGTVYVGTRDNRLIAVNAGSGKLIWTLRTGPDAPLAWGYESGDFYSSSPALDGNRIYWGGGDGYEYAVDRKNGTIVWKFKTDGRIRSTAAVSGGDVFFGSFDGRLYAVNAATGKLKWTYETEGVKLKSGDFGYDRRSIQSSPSVWKDSVLIGARDGFLYAVDRQTGKLLWKYDHEISWVNSSPAVADGKVYAASSDARFIDRVDIATGKEDWRFKSDSLVWSSPALTEHFLYVGDWAGNLYVLDSESGKEVWRFRTGARILSSPVLNGGQLYFGDDNGQVFALRPAAVSLKRAVFWDADYAKGAGFQSTEKLRDYLKKNGYDVLDANGLMTFLNDRKSDREPSVVVFAIDFLPKPLDVDKAGESLLKNYLQSGGKVVWVGMPPEMWEKDLKTGQYPSMKIDREVTLSLLGVGHHRGNFDKNMAKATPAGEQWGLDGWWLSSWSADPETVTTVLATDEMGLAAAWVKDFGGAPGTGFVRVPIAETPDGTPLNLDAIKTAAEYFPQ